MMAQNEVPARPWNFVVVMSGVYRCAVVSVVRNSRRVHSLMERNGGVDQGDQLNPFDRRTRSGSVAGGAFEAVSAGC